MKRLKTVALWIWFIIFALLFSLTLMMSRGKDAIFPGYTPFAILGIFFLPFIVYVIISGFVDKKKQKEKEERLLQYRQQYVRPLDMMTEQFGTLRFDYDTVEDKLAFVSGNLPFIGEGKIDKIEVQNYKGNDAMVISAISCVMNRANEIVDGCTEAVKESYEEDGIRDSQGQPITEEFIRGDLRMSDMVISLQDGFADIEITGGVNTEFPSSFIDEHYIAVEIQGKTEKLQCYIE